MDAPKIPYCDKNWEAIDIFLFSNGQQYSPPRKYHLTSRDLELWPATLKYLAHTHYGSMHSELQIFTTDGKQVEEPIQMTNGSTYVAVEPPDSFICAGYEKYLLKASRSWEKRQAKKCSCCELLTNGKDSLKVDNILYETTTNQIIEENITDTKTKYTLAKSEPQTNQQNKPQDKVIPNKKKPPFVRHTDFRKISAKTVIDPSKNQNQMKNVYNKSKNNVTTKPSIICPIKRGIGKSPTNEKFKGAFNQSIRGLPKTNPKTNSKAKPFIIKTPTKTNIHVSNQYNDVTELLSTNTDSELSNNSQVTNYACNNSKSEHADNKQHFTVIQEENSKNMLQPLSLSNAAKANGFEILSENKELTGKSETNYIFKKHKKDDEDDSFNHLETLTNSDVNNNLDEPIDNNKLGDKNKSEDGNSSKLNSDHISKVINRGDVINLLLRIKFKCNKEKITQSSNSMNLKHVEKESQVNIDMEIAVNSKTLQALLNEDTAKEDGDNSKVVIVQCTCVDSQNAKDKAINDKLNTYLVVLPIFNCERCKSERSDNTKLIATSNVSNNTGTVQEFDELKTNTCLDSRKDSIKSQVTWVSDETDSRNGNYNKEKLSSPPLEKQDYLTIHRNTLKETVDCSSQTEWCNILLETRRHGDGHYTFHIPTLKVLKSYKF